MRNRVLRQPTCVIATYASTCHDCRKKAVPNVDLVIGPMLNGQKDSWFCLPCAQKLYVNILPSSDTWVTVGDVETAPAPAPRPAPSFDTPMTLVAVKHLVHHEYRRMFGRMTQPTALGLLCREFRMFYETGSDLSGIAFKLADVVFKFYQKNHPGASLKEALQWFRDACRSAASTTDGARDQFNLTYDGDVTFCPVAEGLAIASAF